jgi:SAM-dependent MidA family methyltransferase
MFESAATWCRQGVDQARVQVRAHGPIPQAHFLAGLGIEARLDSLTAVAIPSQQESLISGFNRLIGGDEASNSTLPREIVSTPSDHNEGVPAATVIGNGGEGGNGQGNPLKLGGDRRDVLDSGELSLAERFKYAPRPPSLLDDEGMGYTYKVLAITGREHTSPIPFPGSGVDFE